MQPENGDESTTLTGFGDISARHFSIGTHFGDKKATKKRRAGDNGRPEVGQAGGDEQESGTDHAGTDPAEAGCVQGHPLRGMRSAARPD